MNDLCNSCEHQATVMTEAWLRDEEDNEEYVCAKSLDMEIESCPGYEEWTEEAGQCR